MRVTHPELDHMWPSGWRPETDPDDTTLIRDEAPDDGAEDKQAGGEPTAET
ncbi:hypothetical protein ACTMTI_47975 [Nonomuraea sp. H19]|uniref:hypothetical protein n=1 Tax=Nonomuraea sp. H19 TaxID=3452206 RepID=UPI003F895E74